MAAIVGSAGVEIVPSVRNFARDLRAKLVPEARKLGDDLGKDLGDSMRRRLDVSLRRLPDARIGLNVDTGKAAALIDQTARDRHTTINVGLDSSLARTEARLDKLASVGQKALSPIVALGAVGGPAIAGFGAAAIPVFGGIAASLLSAGIGTGAFAAVAIPAFKKLQTGSKGLATAQQNVAKAEKAVNDAQTKAQRNAANKKLADAIQAQSKALKDLSPAEQDAVKQYNSFTTAVKDFEKQNEPEAFSVIGGGFKLIRQQLPKVTPLIKGAAGAFVDLEQDASKALNSKFWTNFEQFVTRQAPKDIRTYGQVAGNTITGLFGIVQGFEPQITTVDRGLLGLSQDFSRFGKDAAAGKSKAFNSFVDFSKSVAPQVKTDLRDIGNLVGTGIKDLGPSIKPALKLIDDVAKDIGPALKPVEQKLPGVINSVDTLARKAQPFIAGLSSGFTSTVANTIKTVATGIGDAIDAVNSIDPGAAKWLGKIAGDIVALAAIKKFTGLSKLPGLLNAVLAPGIGGGGGVLGPTGGGMGGTSGRGVGGAAGKLSKLEKAGLGAALAPSLIGDALIGGYLGYQFSNSSLGKSAQRQIFTFREGLNSLPGPLGSIAKKSNDAVNSLDDLFGNVKAIGGKGTMDMSKFVTVTEKLPNLAKPITVTEKVNGQKDFENAIARAKNKALDLADTKVVTKLQAKDAASHIVAGVQNSVTTLTGTPGIAHLSTQDRASAGIAKVKSGIASIPSDHLSKLRAENDTNKAADEAKSAISSIKGKNVTINALVNGLGAVGSLGGLLGGLRSYYPVTVDVRTVGSAAGLAHIPGLADGGKVEGSGTSTSDSIPLMGSRDEWMINARRSRELGDDFMSWVNYGAGRVPPRHMAAGGPVTGTQPAVAVAANLPPITLVNVTQLDGKEIHRSMKQIDIDQARARRANR